MVSQKINKIVLFQLLLSAYLSGSANAADIATHVLGAKMASLTPTTTTVLAGYYSSTTLVAVDADLSAGNIRAGVDVFGITGTLETAPPAPAAGGAWLLVPGDASLGTRDFYVQKYEARDVGGVPTSQPSGTPWVSINQILAKTKCTALGPGYHLLTTEEAQTISRNIENLGWNWTGGSVGSGGMWRGHTDSAPASILEADISGDPDDDPYVGTGETSPAIERRIHQLSSGQYIWDWSGNVWELLDMTCSSGTGTGFWDNTDGWLEWDAAGLSDHEKVRSGPAGAYTSTQNAGRYYGCVADGNAARRGGAYNSTTYAGPFAHNMNYGPSYSDTGNGFRCGR